MKTKMLGIGALLGCFLLVGCNETVKQELTRTGGTKLNNRIAVSIPLGHQECEDKVEKVCHDWKEECERVCVQGNCEEQCKTIPPGCDYVGYRDCEFVKDKDFHTWAELQFDPRAKLQSGQTEKYTFRGNYNKRTNTIDVRVAVKSKFYEYSYPQSVSLKEGKTTAVKFSAIRVK